MTPAPSARPARPSREALAVAALAIAAALKVWACAAAFPFFTNVDEQKHVDMVLKYARGYLPSPGGEAYEPVMGEWLGLYGSPEYKWERGDAASLPPPAWRRPPEAMLAVIERSRSFLAARPNKEAHQPPTY